MSKRNKELQVRREELETLVAFDFDVKQFSPYHYRIEDRLDIWPSSKKWFDRITHAKGTYQSLLDLAHSRFSERT
jgi:hypothetical protein